MALTAIQFRAEPGIGGLSGWFPVSKTFAHYPGAAAKSATLIAVRPFTS